MEEIVFVSGTTDGLNFIANTYGEKYLKAGDEVLVSLLEHHSNILPWQKVCRETGAVLKVIPINELGEISLEAFESMLSSKTKVVAVTHVSNAIGTVVPLKSIIQSAHRHGAVVVVDGAQGVPHYEVNVRDLGCDFYVFSGHKLYGPTGIGVVYGKKDILASLPPWKEGGGMIENVTLTKTEYAKSPFRFEAGTMPIGEAIGLGAAIDYLKGIGMSNIAAYENELMHYALQKLSELSSIKLIGRPSHRASVISFTLQQGDIAKVGDSCDREGIALRIGHHCAQPALDFFGVKATIRPSLAFYNTHAEIDALINVLQAMDRNGRRTWTTHMDNAFGQ